MSKRNGLSGVGKRAGTPERKSVVGDAIQGELFRLQGEVRRDVGLDELVECLLPAVYEGIRRGMFVSLSSAHNSGVVRLRLFDGVDSYEWYAADAEWATVLGEAIKEVLQKVDA